MQMQSTEIAPETITTFATLQDARDYRHENGTGGWIFEDQQTGKAVLFPPYITPIAIFYHPITKGKSGRLT
jgi:hypothetical protein